MADDDMSVDSDELLGPSDEDDQVTLTAQELLQRIEKAWMTERTSPELQVPLTEEVECMLEQLRTMENNLKGLKKNDIRLPVHKMEVNRIQYLVTSYLRLRLGKIQEFCWQIMHQENKRSAQTPSKLTPEENKFLREYIKNLESYLKAAGTDNMPQTLRKLPIEKFCTNSNLDAFVFFKVNQDTDLIVEDADGTEDEVNLHVGSRHIMRYRQVADLVSSGAISLI